MTLPALALLTLCFAPPEDSAGADPSASVDDAASADGPEDGTGDDAGAGPDDGLPKNAVDIEPVELEPAAAGDGEGSSGDTEQAEQDEGDQDPDDLGLDDIFGTEEDHADIEEQDTSEDQAKPSGFGSMFAGKIDFRLRILSSFYVDIDGSVDGRRWARDSPQRGQIGRNENRLEFYLSYTPNKHIQIVGDIEPVFFGVSQPAALDDLSSRQMLAPFHVESDAAYVAVLDALPGLDIKIGRQILVWGTADKFNPTNNLNPDDLEDRPLFTEPIANQMVVVDFAPWGDKFWAQGVYIPFFYPALLPPSAANALEDPRSPVPYTDQEDLDAISFLQNYIDNNPKFEPRVISNVETPQPSLQNGQAAVKLGSRLGPVDLSASYFYGFHDIPLAYKVESEQLAPLMDEEGIDGYWYQSNVSLLYPRMHVIGADFATQLGFADNAGLWGEAGLFIPKQGYDLNIEMPVSLDVTPEDGVANPIDEINGPTVRSSPFLKATVGADYTLGKHVYLQAQYLRGFIDEFGSGQIGNYLVAGTELVFFGRHLVFRFFAVTDFPKNREDQPSLVLAPNILMVPPWGFLTFELGGFASLGSAKTKFGQPATGTSIVFLKAIGSF